ncbi:hypothetical protein BGZ51_004496 [Haplosporangium sp. Z 767]|nr:hypothetical protein BGZ51_004496 [Haplosporangium sp. Z 767]KAF9182853.1 hypothetical protein BGZ50_004663 [Haplosporangium sp. Z 11]
MNNPTTTTTNHNNTTTAATKPSTMETLKEKAANLAEKVTGKPHGHHDAAGHQTTATSGTVHDPAHLNENLKHSGGPLHTGAGPLHTGAAATGTAIPHGSTVDRTAYQQHGQNTTDPNFVQSSAVPPNQTTTISAAGTSIPGGAPLQHPAPAGHIGTGGHVPTYAQNIPPAAAGVTPTGYGAGQVNDPNAKHLGSHNTSHENRHHHSLNPLHHHDNDNKNATGTVVGAFPVNPHSSTLPANNNPQQVAPMHSNNNTVPAMGAPGTTTAAGTHVPGDTYVPCEYTGTKDFRGNVAPPPGSSMSAEIDSHNVHPK